MTNLPQELNSALIGIMLGDGGIYRITPKGNCRFEMSFGQNYSQFAESIAKLFKEYMKSSIKTIEVKGKNGKKYLNYRLKTSTLPIFNYYHNMFYKYNIDKQKFVKIVPHNIFELLDPIVLAYLIMTDGNFDKGRKRVRIYTNSYSKHEVEILASSIFSKINIYVGVLHDRRDQWILTIGATQLCLLREIVSPHFEASMLYRLGL